MQGLFVSGGLLGLRHERLYTKEDLAVIRRAPAVHHTLFDVGVIPCGTFYEGLNGKNDFGMLSCEVPPAPRSTSLNDDGTTLRGRGDVQRPSRTKESTGMIDAVDF